MSEVPADTTITVPLPRIVVSLMIVIARAPDAVKKALMVSARRTFSEDAADLADARKAMKEPGRNIPFAKVKKELRLR